MIKRELQRWVKCKKHREISPTLPVSTASTLSTNSAMFSFSILES